MPWRTTYSSLPKIGDEFGGRDHTTVMHAHDKITQVLRNDYTEAILSQIKKYLQAKHDYYRVKSIGTSLT